jgi:hypothetical protein
MNQLIFTKQHFRGLKTEILGHLVEREWADAHHKARLYKQHMNQAFSEGHHVVAGDALEQLKGLREPTYSAQVSTYDKFKGLSKDRLYRAFVVEHCPLDPWLAKSFLLHDQSGSDEKLITNLLKNGFFRPEHLEDDVEKQSEAVPRLMKSIDLIEDLLSHQNHHLAAKMIEGLLFDQDLRHSPFVFDDQVVWLLGKGGDSLAFRNFLERMAPRIREICDWSFDSGNRREPCLKATSRPGILKLAEQGLPDLALDLYLHGRSPLDSRSELIRAEEVFGKKLTLWMLAELSHSTPTLTTFEAFVDYFIHDPENKWVFDSDEAVDAMNALHSRETWFRPPVKATIFGRGNDRNENLKAQAQVIQGAFERHKGEPGIEDKRIAFMTYYVSSDIKSNEQILREIRNLYPIEYLMDIPGYAEQRLQEDLGL